MGRADGTFAGHQIVSTGLKSGVINQIEPTALRVLTGILCNADMQHDSKTLEA